MHDTELSKIVGLSVRRLLGQGQHVTHVNDTSTLSLELQ